jgi:hypothetical protein
VSGRPRTIAADTTSAERAGTTSGAGEPGREPVQTVGGDAVPGWVSLTKGECLLLALALHRLAREHTARATSEEDGQ